MLVEIRSVEAGNFFLKYRYKQIKARYDISITLYGNEQYLLFISLLSFASIKETQCYHRLLLRYQNKFYAIEHSHISR